MIFRRLFAKSGVYPAYHMYSGMHILLLLACTACVVYALWRSRGVEKKEVPRLIRKCTAGLWGLEIAKIVFNLAIGNAANPNTYLPLYFCSLVLYCGLFSGYGKGILKHIGDVFLVVGGIVGGTAYLLSPCTTAGTYPAFHFITIQSYVHHSVMIYLGLLCIFTRYIELQKKDILYYAGFVTAASALAFGVNLVLDTNLMFVSKNNPGTAVEVLYFLNPTLFPLLITFCQAGPTFLIVRAIQKCCHRSISKQYYAEI